MYFSSPSRIGICRPPHHKLKQVAFGCGMIHEIFNSHFCFYLCEQPRFGVRAVRTVVFDRGCSDQINRGLAERGGLAIYFKPPLRQTPSRESRKHHRQPIGLILMFSQLDLPLFHPWIIGAVPQRICAHSTTFSAHILVPIVYED